MLDDWRGCQPLPVWERAFFSIFQDAIAINAALWIWAVGGI